jgi:hypothetical protein
MSSDPGHGHYSEGQDTDAAHSPNKERRALQRGPGEAPSQGVEH